MKINRYILSIASFLVSYFSLVQAQTPDVQCISVNSNGDVEVTFAPNIGGSGSFVSHNMYADAGSGFGNSAVTSVANSTTLTDPSVDANASSVSFYLHTNYSNGSTTSPGPNSDTLSSIFLNVNNPSDGTAILQWNDLKPIMTSDYGGYYYIEKNINASGFNLLDSVSFSAANYYRDTITVCSAQVDYRIYAVHNSGCYSYSNVDGEILEDLIPPDAPVITELTVDTANGSAIIEWNPSIAQDASAYIVLQNVNGGWIIIDTVYGYNNTTFTHPSADVNSFSEWYGIAAFDSCWNGMPPAPNTSPMGTPHNTIFTSNTFDKCELIINVNWNAYVNWDAGVLKYNLYVSENETAYTLLYSGTDTSYAHNNVLPLTNYKYIIECVSNNLVDTVISNVTARFSAQPSQPKYAYIENVTVVDNHLEVNFMPDMSGVISSAEWFRDDGSGFVSLLGESSVSATMTYIDDAVNVEEDVYKYKVLLKDSCGNPSITSNISNNIVLLTEANTTSLVNLLQWNAYNDFNGNLVRYDIYRSVNGEYPETPFASVSGNQLYYQDDISNLLGSNSNGEYCYYIEAVESTNEYGKSAVSMSNEVCVFQEELVYIPNALALNGFNNNWKPVVDLLRFESYNVKVFTHNKKLIFESTDVNEAWDGTFKGAPVPTGVYVYLVEYTAANQQAVVKRGTITVFK